MKSASALATKVRRYYLDHLRELRPYYQFHFLSRLWLWGADREAGAILRQQQPLFLPESPTALRQYLRAEMTAQMGANIRYADLRTPILARYPKLIAYDRLILLAVFARTVYGRDIRVVLSELVPQEKLLGYRQTLHARPRDVAILSSYAVNYFFLADFLFGGDQTYVAPNIYYEIAETYYTDDGAERDLRLYLLLHVVIAASYFYYSSLTQRDVLRALMALAEAEFKARFEKISLDLKFEFLVCAALSGYATDLRGQILHEAERSRAVTGNFIASARDTARAPTAQLLEQSEHQNILFVMAVTPCAPRSLITTLPTVA